MALFKNQSQYDELVEAENAIERALQEWKDAGGPVAAVVRTINQMIDLRVEITLENRGRDEVKP